MSPVGATAGSHCTWESLKPQARRKGSSRELRGGGGGKKRIFQRAASRTRELPQNKMEGAKLEAAGPGEVIQQVAAEKARQNVPYISPRAGG